MNNAHRPHTRVLQFARQALLAAAVVCSGGHALAAGTSLSSATKSEAQTKYPIVLVHGLFGFGQALGTVDYFWGIPSALKAGGADVYIAELSSVNSNEVRGEQLLQQIDRILALTGAKKVNIIGHSQGAPTARYVAGVAPDKVASVTSFGGAHKGSKLADLLKGVKNVTDNLGMVGSVTQGLILKVVEASGKIEDVLIGKPGSLPVNALEALRGNSTAGMADFNKRFPAALPPSYCGSEGANAVNGVRYWSWTGSSPSTNLLDPFDYLTLFTKIIYMGAPNDGINDNCTQRLGKVVGDYPYNHFDEINQLVGLRGLFSPDPVRLYYDHARRLKANGI